MAFVKLEQLMKQLEELQERKDKSSRKLNELNDDLSHLAISHFQAYNRLAAARIIQADTELLGGNTRKYYGKKFFAELNVENAIKELERTENAYTQTSTPKKQFELTISKIVAEIVTAQEKVNLLLHLEKSIVFKVHDEVKLRSGRFRFQ